MKKILLGVMAMAAMLFTGCSNDDDNAPINGGEVSGDAVYYMSVRLSMSDATRAVTDGGYDDGTDAESKVKVANTKFYFYDQFGTYLTSGTLANDVADANGFMTLNASSSDKVSHTSNPLIILGPSEKHPVYVIAVLNSTVNLENMKMSEAYELVCNAAIGTAGGDFTMTNATYMKGDKIIYMQDIEDKIYTDETTAKNNPADIYVERIVAKVAMEYSGATAPESFNVEDNYLSDNGSNFSSIKVRVKVDGWCLNTLNTQTTYLKNLNAAWNTNAPFENWNDAFRSYWALDGNYTSTKSPTAEGYQKTSETYTGLTYKSWDDADKNTASVEYCYENTVDKSHQMGNPDDRTNVTTMLIAAHAEYSTDGGSNWTADVDLYKFNGVLYTLEGYTNLYLDWLKEQGYCFYKEVKDGEGNVTSTEWEDFATTNVTFTVNGIDFKSVSLKLATAAKDGFSLVKKGADDTYTETTIEAINTDITTNFNVAKKSECYKGGKCYYQVPIEHLGSTASSRFYGVVRNHSYKLVLNSISRLGDPVYNPEAGLEYIPGEKEDYYVAARLHILKWRVVNQKIDL